MLQFILKRILLMIPTLFVISVIAFIVIQLPPGDFLSSYINNRQAEGTLISNEEIINLRQQYGLDKSMVEQYFIWIGGVLKGDYGYSFLYRRPVSELIWERLALTFAVSLITLLFTWVIAFPVGIFSAVKQYSIGDYIATAFGFLGLSIPGFLFALVLMVLAFQYFSLSLSGLFSPEYAEAPWSWAKVGNLLQHMWIPVIVLGLSGTAGMIRTMRANLLDELHKPYVITARAKGQSKFTTLLRYPVRAALNPFVSTIGYTLPNLVSGSIIVSVVLSLPTTGPLLLSSLMAQDMYLAGAYVLLLSSLTVVGTLVSDILLAWLDPRIRMSIRG
jgi:peptide/nickel transport system permease protein